MDMAQRGWEHLIRDVQQAFPGAEVVCWRYEDLANVRSVVTASLFGVPAAQLPPHDARRERQSFPRLAIRLLDDLYVRAGAETATRARASVEEIIKGPQMPRFEPWDAEELLALSSAYERSLTALKALPGVRFIA